MSRRYNAEDGIFRHSQGLIEGKRDGVNLKVTYLMDLPDGKTSCGIDDKKTKLTKS